MKTRRSARGQRLVLSSVVLLALVGPLAAACGGAGGDKLAPDDWAEEVCDLFIDWEEETADIGSDALALDWDADPEDALDEYIELIEDTSAENLALEEGLAELGEPDVEGGRDFQQAINRMVTEYGEDYVEFIADVEDDVDPDDDPVTEITDLIGDLDRFDPEDAVEDVVDDFDDTEELLEEIQDNEDCYAVFYGSPEPEPSGEATGDPTPDPTSEVQLTDAEWAATACNLDTQHYTDLQTLIDEYDDTSPDPEVQRAELLTFVDEATFLSWDLADDFFAMPTPGIPGGEEFRQAYVDAFNQIGDLFDDAWSIVDAGDGSTQEGFDALYAESEPLIVEAFDLIDAHINGTAGSTFWVFAADIPECDGVNTGVPPENPGE